MKLLSGTNRLLLVDGHNLLFKAFYGIPPRILPSGKAIHGVIGFLGVLKKISAIVSPSHLLIVFDSEKASERKNEYEPYKSNRTTYESASIADNPFSQLSDIKRVLDVLHINWVEVDGCEADDVIASYTLSVEMPVVIASSDSDFFQLITENRHVFRYNGKRSVMFDHDEVYRRYSVSPGEFILFKALIGDATDNIPGIRGVGPKKALKIIRGQVTLTSEEQDLVARNMNLITLRQIETLPKEVALLEKKSTLEGIGVGALLKKLEIL